MQSAAAGASDAISANTEAAGWPQLVKHPHMWRLVAAQADQKVGTWVYVQERAVIHVAERLQAHIPYYLSQRRCVKMLMIIDVLCVHARAERSRQTRAAVKQGRLKFWPSVATELTAPSRL